MIALLVPSGEASTARDLLDAMESGSDYQRGEASDYAINTLREAAAAAGVDRLTLAQIFREEAYRCRGLPPHAGGLRLYLTANRKGSRFRLSRSARALIFVQLAAKGQIP